MKNTEFTDFLNNKIACLQNNEMHTTLYSLFEERSQNELYMGLIVAAEIANLQKTASVIIEEYNEVLTRYKTNLYNQNTLQKKDRLYLVARITKNNNESITIGWYKTEPTFYKLKHVYIRRSATTGNYTDKSLLTNCPTILKDVVLETEKKLSYVRTQLKFLGKIKRYIWELNENKINKPLNINPLHTDF